MNKIFGEENETKTKPFKGAQVLWPKEIPDDIFKDVKNYINWSWSYLQSIKIWINDEAKSYCFLAQSMFYFAFHKNKIMLYSMLVGRGPKKFEYIAPVSIPVKIIFIFDFIIIIIIIYAQFNI